MPRRITRGNRHIDRRECMLVQAERFAGEAFDAIPRDRRAEGAGCDREPETRMGFMVRQDR